MTMQVHKRKGNFLRIQRVNNFEVHSCDWGIDCLMIDLNEYTF